VETDRGLAVVLGCAHSGLVNTLDRIAGLSNHARIHAVVGGMHLARASLGRLEATAQALGPFAPDLIAPCHCTGEGATTAMNAHLGPRVREISAGGKIDLANPSCGTVVEWNSDP